MHDMELDHEHGVLSEVEKAEIARFIWSQETVELTTVGIDIGSSTSHLLFAKVTLQRQTQGLSSRFVVIGREVVWRSDVMLTPFLRDDTIDAAALGHFIAASYKEAGFAKSDVDSGAVILTGEAIKRRNARAIDELFAEEAGKFVCATAGHKLECLLAAHGSGAVQLSKDRNTSVLHVDIGGGTTKLALVDKGVVLVRLTLPPDESPEAVEAAIKDAEAKLAASHPAASPKEPSGLAPQRWCRHHESNPTRRCSIFPRPGCWPIRGKRSWPRSSKRFSASDPRTAA